MSEFKANLRTPPSQGNQAWASRSPASTPPRAQQQQAIEGSFEAKRKKVAGEKRKRPAEDPVPVSPHLVDLSGFMADSKVAAKAEATSCEGRGR